MAHCVSSCSTPSRVGFDGDSLAAPLGREFIGTELDLNLFKRASKFEWHLRVVLVDDWRSGIHTDVEAFIEDEFADRRGLLDATFGHFLAIDRKSSR